MVSTVTTMIPLRVMVPTVTAAMTRPMMVVMSPVVVIVVTMVAVIKHRAQGDECDRRCNCTMTMICPGRRTGEAQGNQANNRHDP